MRAARAKLAVLVAGLGVAHVCAQSPLLGDAKRPVTRPEAVEYLYPEQVNLTAGKPAMVSLHFRVAAGMHINSHSPKEEFLIPTTLAVPEASGVRLESAEFPRGTDYVLPADPETRLNVYTGEFAIEARLVAAAAGDHLVEARLRYQACDQTQCMPPRTITVPIDVVAK